MEEQTKEFLKLIYAINEVADDLIVGGSLAQYFHLEKQHRNIADIDIIFFNKFNFISKLKEISEILNKEYILSSCRGHSKDSCKIKLYNAEIFGIKKTKHYVNIDIKSKKEIYIIKENVRIIKFEQLLSNKIATSLIGNNVSKFLRVKDLYDLNFLLDIKDYDFDLMVCILTQRLMNNGISNIFDTFLFKDEAESVYLEHFKRVQTRYALNENVDLFKIKKFLYEKGATINKKF